MILVFWMWSFKPIFSLSSFVFIKRLFSSSSLSAIRVVSSAHLRLLMVFPVVMYGCESWTIKKVEHQRIDAFELSCWRRLLRVHPKGYQSWIFTGRTDVEAETPILWPPDMKNWLIGKCPDDGKDWRWEKKGTTEDKMVGCFTDSMDMSLSKLRELMRDRESWHTTVDEVTKSWTRLSD